VSCRHHLYLDVADETGSIKLCHPDKNPEDMTESCSLDVADRGGVILETVGDVMNITRERVRQLESKITTKLRNMHLRGKLNLVEFFHHDSGREHMYPAS
jgi:hypothetical protein